LNSIKRTHLFQVASRPREAIFFSGDSLFLSQFFVAEAPLLRDMEVMYHHAGNIGGGKWHCDSLNE
jgi:hypothetical protein